MKANVILFWLLAGFFAFCTGLYIVWSLLDSDHGAIEPAGTVALALATMLGVFIAFYLGRVHRNQGGELPEDRLDANIDDGDPELGHFSPWSWWPIVLAAGAATALLGIGIGVWITFIAVPVVLIALVGWTYEYYRGYFAH